jgi:ethanolamine utilization protein EutA
MARLAESMAQAVLASVANPPSGEVRGLFLTEPLPGLGRVDGVMFSGGVAEYVYGREARDFGDMGRLLGLALRDRLDAGALPWPLLPPGECIRATALGASEYSVQLSGNTIYISDPGALLPRRNLQVLQPDYACGERIDPDALARAIRAHFTAFDLVEGETEAALALRSSALSRSARLYTSWSTATSRRPWARSCETRSASRARSSSSTAWSCGTSTTSISGASACLRRPCR